LPDGLSAIYPSEDALGASEKFTNMTLHSGCVALDIAADNALREKA